jgi:tetratricopeptide (TPR) repeat protein
VLGKDYSRAGDLDRAIAHYRRAQRLDPVNPLLLGTGPWLPVGPAEVYLWQGRHDEAVEEYVRIATLRGASANEVGAMRSAFAASGMPGFWRSWLEMDLRQSGRTPDPLRICHPVDVDRRHRPGLSLARPRVRRTQSGADLSAARACVREAALPRARRADPARDEVSGPVSRGRVKRGLT